MTAIEPSDFAAIFGNGPVRARLDWGRIADPCLHVEESFACSRRELGRLTTVWYRGPDGGPSGIGAPGAFPVRVRAAASGWSSWSTRRAALLEKLMGSYREAGEPVILVLPCYATARHRILLDGNHRAVAAYASGVDVRALIYALCGPDDPAMLPDLRYVR